MGGGWIWCWVIGTETGVISHIIISQHVLLATTEITAQWNASRVHFNLLQNLMEVRVYQIAFVSKVTQEMLHWEKIVPKLRTNENCSILQSFSIYTDLFTLEILMKTDR